MQDMNPDMEDLMRKASEAYPLRPMDDRWDEIVSKIPVAQPPAENKNRGYGKYYAFTILLLLFLFLGSFFFNNRRSYKPPVARAASEKDSGKINNRLTPSVTYSVKKKKITATQIEKENPEYVSYSELPTNMIVVKAMKSDHLNLNKKITNNGTGAELFASQKLKGEPISKLIADPFQINEFNLSLKSLQHINWDSLLKTSQKKHQNKLKGFYYGIMAGPGLNAVHDQGLKKAGLNIGLLAGYSFGKNLSLETGVLFSKKHYMTSGDNFSMKVVGSSMPSSMKIMQVDGYSRVIEIPVSVHYNFAKSRNGNFFGTTGLSSYLLTNENNQYHTLTNGAAQMMYGNYNKNKSYVASSIDVGLGYLQNFGKKSSIRFQPYLQIPVKGIGVGDLHVMGTGIRLALVQRAY
jgi:hypothetical protein